LGAPRSRPAIHSRIGTIRTIPLHAPHDAHAAPIARTLDGSLARVEETTLIDAAHPDPIGALEELLARHRRDHPDDRIVLVLGYALGGAIEPKGGSTPDPFPRIVAQRLGDHAPATQPSPVRGWRVDPATLEIDPPHRYTARVRRALDLIAAGDVYQVNLAHAIRAGFEGDAPALAAHLFGCAEPAHGSLCVFDHDGTRHAVVSCSPELFLSFDASTRTLASEPMKGTRPIGTDPAALRDAPKDKAELNMIVDLMRNDLARVAEPASVRVRGARSIRAHRSGVLQATARIECTPQPNIILTDILRAAFPPGSITGAPKVRAMQIIAAIEDAPRGPYCGSTLVLEPDGSFSASVNIRTLHIVGRADPGTPSAIRDATLTYHAGAGIVADSDPEDEWRETLTKASILETALGLPIGRGHAGNP